MADYIIATLLLVGGVIWTALTILAESMRPIPKPISKGIGWPMFLSGPIAAVLGALYWYWLLS